MPAAMKRNSSCCSTVTPSMYCIGSSLIDLVVCGKRGGVTERERLRPALEGLSMSTLSLGVWMRGIMFPRGDQFNHT